MSIEGGADAMAAQSGFTTAWGAGVGRRRDDGQGQGAVRAGGTQSTGDEAPRSFGRSAKVRLEKKLEAPVTTLGDVILWQASFPRKAWEEFERVLFDIAVACDIPTADDLSLHASVSWGRALSSLATALRRSGVQGKAAPPATPSEVTPVDCRITVSMRRRQFWNFWECAADFISEDPVIHFEPWALHQSDHRRGVLLHRMAAAAAQADDLTAFSFDSSPRLRHLYEIIRPAAVKKFRTSCDGKLLLNLCREFLRTGVATRYEFLTGVVCRIREVTGGVLILADAHEPYLKLRSQAVLRECTVVPSAQLGAAAVDPAILYEPRIVRHVFLAGERFLITRALESALRMIGSSNTGDGVEAIVCSYALSRLDRSWVGDLLASVVALTSVLPLALADPSPDNLRRAYQLTGAIKCV